jgi:inner membrane protein
VPTLITHALVGAAAAATIADHGMSVRFWSLSIACAVLPDADVIGFACGVPYHHMFGHRGFFHSLSFAALLAVTVVLVFFPQEEFASKQWGILVGHFFLVSASHGILDAFTNGGLGIALLAPFDNTRYFLEPTLIEVAPIGIGAFFSQWGVRVMKSEFIWVWVPASLIVLLTRLAVRPIFFPKV